MGAPKTFAAVTVATAGVKVPLLASNPSPQDLYHTVRVEIDQSAGANKIYVGDLNVSATRYIACLTLTGQMSVTLQGYNLDPAVIFLDASASAVKAQWSAIK